MASPVQVLKFKNKLDIEIILNINHKA